MTDNLLQQDNLMKLIIMTLEGSKVELTNPQWSEILRLAREQALSGFVAQAAINYGADNSEEFRTDLLMQINHSVRLRHAQRKLHQILTENGIDYAIIKGSAAEIYYPDKVVRTMGDVDFLVRKDDYRRTYDLLQNAGFSNRDEGSFEFLNRINPRHIGLIYNGIEIEIHKYFLSYGVIPATDLTNKETSSLTDEFNSLLEKNLNNRVICYKKNDLNVVDFFRLPDMINGLILIQHINLHFINGLGLRQIIDWMMFVKACSEEDWWNEFEGLLERYHLSKLAFYLTAFCKVFLGLDGDILKNIDITDEKTLKICGMIKEKLFEDGNLGRSFGTNSKTIRKALNYNYGISESFKRLQMRGISNWEAARKYEILKPFAWIYQIGCFILPLIKRKNPIKSIRHDLEEADTERELLRYLGMM